MLCIFFFFLPLGLKNSSLPLQINDWFSVPRFCLLRRNRWPVRSRTTRLGQLMNYGKLWRFKQRYNHNGIMLTFRSKRSRVSAYSRQFCIIETNLASNNTSRSFLRIGTLVGHHRSCSISTLLRNGVLEYRLSVMFVKFLDLSTREIIPSVGSIWWWP